MFRNYGEFRPANIFSLREDDSRFPLSPAVQKSVKLKTLPKIDQENLEAPFEIMCNLNFGRIKENHGSNGSVAERMRTPIAPPPREPLDDDEARNRYAVEVANYTRHRLDRRDGMSRFFQTTEQPWKTVTPSDWRYELSFVDFVPPGMRTTPRRRQEQEYTFRPPFENAIFSRRDQNYYLERVDPRNDTQAREHVHATTQHRICWNGCSQRQQTRFDPNRDVFCCPSVRRNHYFLDRPTLVQHHKDVRNQRIECPRNDAVYASISTLNLDRKVPLRKGDNQENYIHVFKFEPLHSEHNAVQTRVLNSRSSQRRDFSTTQLHALYLAEIEFGILGTDAGLQMSLDDRKKQLQMSERQRFVTASRTYQEDKLRYTFGTGVAGPPLANPTQLFHFAAYRLKNIREHRWEARIHPTLTGLPISHKSTLALRVHVCVCVCV